MANTTGEAVTLTSKRAVCMYPLLGLKHRCAYWFGENQRQTNVTGYKRVTSHLLPGQDPLAKAMRTELGRKRSLGDKQCLIIPMAANRGTKSGWTIEIQSRAMITWTDDRLGIISGNWQTARRTVSIMKKDQHHGGTPMKKGASMYVGSICIYKTLLNIDLARGSTSENSLSGLVQRS
jgi:hypothetical protein